MIVIVCPNCGARYRLAESVLAKGGRLRCAACDHRWVPEAVVAPAAPVEIDEDAALAQVQAQMQARWEVPAAAAPVEEAVEPDEPVAEAVVPVAGSKWLRSVVAVIAGAALAVAAVGLWGGQVGLDAEDLAVVPGAADVLARLAPPEGSPLVVTVKGVTTMLPSGAPLLEVTGRIANPGTTAVRVPALTATLAGPGGVALRWTIAAPVAMLPGGQEVEFSSNVTGFPKEARVLAVTPVG